MENKLPEGEVKYIEKQLKEIWGNTGIEPKVHNSADEFFITATANTGIGMQISFDAIRKLRKAKPIKKADYLHKYGKAFEAHEKMEKQGYISIPWFAYDNQLIGNVFHAVGNKEFEQFCVRYKINLPEFRTRIRKGKIKYALKK